MKKKVLVAMSGGVDSSVAAALLQEQGYEVGGATIRTWTSSDCPQRDTNTCCGIAGVRDAQGVAKTLGISYWIFNFEKEFREHVMDAFAEEYAHGRTPNPCICCNEHIKFTLFLERARELGFDTIATGHYAKLEQDESLQRYFISEGEDPEKDQSYVLFPLKQDLLKHLLLPVGSFTKAQIRGKAKTLGLQVMAKPDSQEICFVPNDEYGPFLKKEYFKDTIPSGIIRTREGKGLGKHPGYYYFTKGQRRGLGVAFSERLYVTEIHPETNEVVVGTRQDTRSKEMVVDAINWFLKPSASEFEAFVKIRSRHKKAKARCLQLSESQVRVIFEGFQESITEGQAAVFYEGGKVLGGGWILRVGNVECGMRS